MENLTSQDINIILEAMDLYDNYVTFNKQQSDNPIVSMLSKMNVGQFQSDDNKKDEEEKHRAAKDQIIMLKAKLLQIKNAKAVETFLDDNKDN
ncbi:hypothetical protein HN682_06790 [Candidatus Peregrinibacteria bacterium]|jgi:hypothetical protein|nr:hypothetical protein [Candidatus Peregrinibacteria bacterium]